MAIEGPGYLATFLDHHAIPWQLICVDENESIPAAAEAYSGLVFMGGPMSVNDELPWIPGTLALICDAHARDIPLLGHCLGGQLIAKALGGVVGRNPIKEIGWGSVSVTNSATADHWFGEICNFEAFHWHGETFTLPPGAERVLSSQHCVNQAFVIGKHFGMQCHIEMTEEMIRNWCTVGADEIRSAASSPAVQSAEIMQIQMRDKLPPLHRVADRIYTRWVHGLRLD